MTSSAFAQNDADTSNYNIEDLYKLGLDELLTMKIASATKFEESVNEIPHSIFIITSHEIKNYGYRTLSEILQHVTGFYMVDDHSLLKQNFGVRGFFRDEWNRNIIFLVNGVRQQKMNTLYSTFSFINIPVESIERIEIIKGAASVSYGVGAFMGVVNIITTPQKNKTNAYISAGSQNTLKAGFNISQKKDDIQYTLNAGIGKTNGINQNYNKMGLDTNVMSGDYMHEQFGYLSFSVRNKYLFSNLTFENSHNNRPIAFPPYLSSIYEGEADFRVVRYMLGANINLTDLLKMNISYQLQYQDEEFNFEIPNRDYDRAFQNTNLSSHEIDFNVKSQFNKKFSSSVGLNIIHIPSKKDEVDMTLLGYNNNTEKLNNPCDMMGLYYRMAWAVAKKISFKGGIKFDKTFKYSTTVTNNSGNQYIDPNGLILDSIMVERYNYPDYGFSIIPELSFLCQISNKQTLKLIYAKAVNKLSIQRIKDAEEGIKPEYIQNIELNHMVFVSDKIKVNSSIFYNIYTDLVAIEFFIEDGVQVQVANNSGKIATVGFETAIDYRPSEKMQLFGALNYNHSTDLNHKSEYPAFSPSFLGVFNMSYFISPFTIAFTNHFVSRTNPKYNYQLSNPNDMNSSPIGRVGKTAPAYLNTGVNLIYQPKFIKEISVNLRVSNLFNQNMYYPVNDFNNWTVDGTLGISRTILAGLTYKLK